MDELTLSQVTGGEFPWAVAAQTNIIGTTFDSGLRFGLPVYSQRSAEALCLPQNNLSPRSCFCSANSFTIYPFKYVLSLSLLLKRG